MNHKSDFFKKITTGNISVYQKRLADELKLSPATVKRRLSSIRKFCNWAGKEGYLGKKPSLQIPLQKPSLGLRSRIVASKIIKLGFSFALVIILTLLVSRRFLPSFLKISSKLPLPGQITTQTIATYSPWIVNFRAKLLSPSGEPITEEAKIIFKIYSQEKEGESLWESKTWELEPNPEGEFQAPVGDTTRGDKELPSRLFFQNEKLFLEIEVDGQTLTPRTPLSTASHVTDALNLGGFPPSQEPQGDMVPVLTPKGNLILASSSPTIESTSGTFALQGQALSITTAAGTNGNITLAPDGSGVLNLISSGNKGNFVNARNANLTQGALYYGEVASDAIGYNLLELASGSTPTSKFSVDAQGNVKAARLSNITGYYQDSGIFKIDQGGPDYFQIKKSDLTASVDSVTMILDETGKTASGYDTLVLSRKGGTTDAYALYISSGNARFADNLRLGKSLTIDENLNLKGEATLGDSSTDTVTVTGNATVSGNLGLGGQLQLGRFSGTPTSMGTGALVYNTSDSLLYYDKNGSWSIVGGGLQEAYSVGNAITTTNARDIQFNLADTATDANFFVDLDGSGSVFAVRDNNNANLFAVQRSNALINASTRFGTLSIANLASGGDIGTAATTVDIYTSFNLTQTTSGQTITLPNPSDATAGRLVYLSNTGTTTFTLYSSTVKVGDTTAAMWDGDSWNLAGGGGLTQGTVNNSTLRWNSTTSQWAENTSFLVNSSGQVTAGTWQGTAIGTQYGGTGQDWSTVTVGALPYFSGTGTMSTLGAGTANYLLMANGAAAPSWTNAINGVSIGQTTPAAGAFTTLSSTGVTTLGNNTSTVAIDSSDWDISTSGDMTGIGSITADGTITFSGLSTGVVINSSGALSSEAQLATARGGLGANVTAAGAGEILYSTGTTTYGHLAAGTSGQALLSGGTGTPTFGTLGLTYGGTNADLSGVDQGGLIYKGASALAGTGALSGILQGNGSSAPTAITGTANYLPKWSASAPYLTTTSTIYDNGNVGIGTTSPTSLLSVGSTSQFQVNSSGQVTSGTWQGTAVASQYGGTGQNWSGTLQGNLPYFSGTGVMSVLAPSTAGYVLQTNGASANPSWVDISASGGPWTLTGNNLYPDSTAYNVAIGAADAGSAKLYVNGNVGIGTTNPLAALSVGSTSQFQVNSSGQVTSGTWQGTAVATQYGGTGQNWSSTTQGALPYFSGTGVMSTLGVGTAGYVLQTGGAGANPSWVDISASGGPWTLTGNNLYPDSTAYNVGIGTTSPSEKLDIAGNATISGTLALGPNVQVDAGTCNASNAGKQYYDGTNDVMYYCNGSSWIAMGTALDITGSGTANYIPKWSNSSTLADSVLYETGSQIGIGTTNPASKLEVVGTAQMIGFKLTTNPAAGYFLTSDASGVGTWADISASGGPWTLVGNNLYPDSTVYNVGIGTTNPLAALSVGSTSQFQVNSSGAIAATTGITSSGDITFSTLNAGGLVKATNGTGALGLASGGTDYEFPLTFGNGLTRSINVVALGGVLNQTTTLTQGNHTFTVNNNGIANTIFNLSSTGDFDIQDNGVSALFVRDDGLVGIGTSAPGAALDVNGNLLVQGGGTIDTRAAGTLILGGTTQAGLTLGRSGTTTSLVGSNVTAGGVSYGASNTLTFTAAGSSGQTLLSGGAGAPTWGTLGLTYGGTNANLTANAGGIVYSNTSALAINTPGTSGQALLSGGTGTPTFGTLGLTYGGTNADLSGVDQGGLIYKGASALAGTGALSGILQGNGSSAPTAITGTANYLPKWSATAPYLTATSNLYDDGTNVGIGTTNPTQKFQVNDTATAAFVVTSAGQVGIGTTSPSAILDIVANLSAIGSKIITASNAGTEKFYIDKDGNLYAAGTILSGSGQGMLMTNKSGGTVANRSLVIIDTTTNSSFTTTTTPYSKSAFGVVTGVGLGVANDADSDGVCDANDICMVVVGGEVEVTTKNATSASRGDYLYTSDTASSAVASAKQFDGLIGVVSNTAGAASGYLKMIFKVQPQVTATASIDKGSKHNEYWLYANKYTGVGEGSDVNANLLSRGLSFDNLLDSTKTDSANTTVGAPTQTGGTAAPFRAGLINGQTYSTATTDNAGNTYLGSNTVNKTFYYDRTRDSSPQVQVELGLDPNWYNGVTLSVATSSAQFSQNSTVPGQPKNPNLSPTYNGSLIKATGTYATAAAARTIYITIKSPTTFDWTDYNGNSATGTTITPGTAQALGSTGVSAKFTNAKYNTGDVFKIASWFVEPSGSTRGTKAQFPERSYVVGSGVSNSTVYVDIIDADTQKLWMHFQSNGKTYAGPSNMILPGNTTGNVTSLNMLNGQLYVAKNVDLAYDGLDVIRFTADSANSYNTSGYLTYQGGISQRNTQLTPSYVYTNTSLTVVHSTSNDVSAAVIPNQPTQTVTVSGWGYMVGSDLSYIRESVNLPYKFNSIPNVVTTATGYTTSIPINSSSCTGVYGQAVASNPSIITNSGFYLNISTSTGTFSSSYYYCYTWTATGQVSPRTYVAVGTAGGSSIINETDQSVSNVITGYAHNRVWLTNKPVPTLYQQITSGIPNQGQVEVVYNFPTNSTRSICYNFNGCNYSTPVINNVGNSTLNQNTSLYVTEGTSTIDGKSNTIYVGNEAGFSVIQEKQSGTGDNKGTDESNGSVKYYTKDYISEEMVGDIRGMWPMNYSGLAQNTTIASADVSVKANAMTTAATATIPTTGVSGVRGTAMSFDGGDYICTGTSGTCADNSNFDAMSTMNAGAWVKRTSTLGTEQAIISKFNNGADGAFTLRFNTNNTICWAPYNGGTLSGCLNSNKAITDTNWHYIVGTLDSTGRKIYIDGILDASDTSTGTTHDVTTALTIGAEYTYGAVANYFSGTIDEIFFTANTLTTGQIKHMYEVGYRALQSHATTLGGGAADANQQLGYISTGTNTVGAVGVDYNNQFMYVGTNDTTLGAVSKIDLNSDTNIKTYNSSANVPTGGTLLVDEDTKSLAVGYNLEAVGSAASGVKSMSPDNNSNGTSGNFISKTLTTAESFTQAYIWSQHVTDSSDTSNIVTVWASNDGGSNYYQCNQTNADTSQTPTEYEYFCQFNTAGSSLKIKEVFARGSTKTNTYVTRYGIAWIGSDAIGGAPGGNGLYTNNNSSVADGSYVEVAHNQNTSDLVAGGWINLNGQWKDISTATESGIISTSGSVAHNSYLELTHNQETNDILAQGWIASGSAYYKIDAAGGTPAEFASDSNTKGLWHINETANDTCSGGEDACDSSGNGNHGTATGTTIIDGADGRFGKARSFNGSSNYINVPAPSSLQITGQITVSVWVKPVTASNFVIFKETTGGGGDYWIDFVTGKWRCATEGGVGSVISGVDAQLNQWTHVVLTYTTSALTCYVNGIAQGTDTTPGSLIGNTNPIIFAGYPTTPTTFFNGSIDEVRISNTARSAGDIYQDWLNGSAKYQITQPTKNTARLYNYSGSTQTLRLDVSTQAFQVRQVDANTARLYNYSGSTQNLRLDVITGGLGRNAGTVSLAPLAADVDSQDNLNSIWVNKTGTGGNLLKLQTSGTDKFVVDSTGALTSASTASFNSGGATIDSSNFVNAARFVDTASSDYFLDPAASGTSAVFKGYVGIGTTSPSNPLHVRASGVIARFESSSLALNESVLVIGTQYGEAANRYMGIFARYDANWNWVDNEFTFNTAGNAYADGAWTGGGADVAEWTPTLDKTLEPGDILIIDGTSQESLVKKSDGTLYDSKLIGVVSTNPGLVSGGGETEKEHGIEYGDVLVALAGRVPVKVSTINGPIKVGDPITSSEIPGVGMKATKAGPIIGKALESWTSDSGKEKIMVFINVGWYDPDVYLTSNGDLKIISQDATYSGLLADETETQNSNVKSQKYNLKVKTGEIIQRIGAFAELIAANIKAGRIETQELVSPVAEIEEIKTQRISLAEISPATESGDIVINLENQNSTESAFGKLIVKGDVSISGQLSADSLQIEKDATIAGTLYADEIITKHGKFGDLLVNKIAKTAENTSEESTPSAILSEEEINNLINEILASASPKATSQAVLAENINIPNDLLVSNSLNIGGTLSLADNAVNTLSGPLYLQSLGLGGIDILAGKIVIDEHGNATFEGNVTIKGKLAAKSISPLPENDLVIDLAQISVEPEATQSAFGKLLVKGFDGQTVASIDASGSARFTEVATQKLIIASQNVEPELENQVSGVVSTNATAGKATLLAGETEITIKSPFVTENTLIYVTPITDTQNKVLFVKAKKAASSTNELGWFKVGIDTPINSEIKFNWWLIN